MKNHRWTHVCARLLVGLCCALLLVGPPAFAGTLDDFERAATGDEHGPSQGYRPGRDDDDDDDDSVLWAIVRGMFRILFFSRADDDGYADFDGQEPGRQPGRGPSAPRYASPYNPVLRPMLRFDSAYQNVRADVRAWDVRAEGGYEFLAVQGRVTGYLEDTPRDTLWLNYVHGLLRLSFGEHLAIQPGAGAMILAGNDRNAGFSLTLPVLMYPQPALGIEFRPTWSWIRDNPINDYDVSLVAGGKHLAFRAGYRWTSAGDEMLDGVHLGLTVRF